MILEMTVLHVKPGQADEVRAAFGTAEPIIAASAGCVSHELHRA